MSKQAPPPIEFIKIEDIYVPETRQRQYIDKDALNELTDSIMDKGLLQNLTLNEENQLIIGNRRLEAVKLIYERSIPIIYGDSACPFGTVPCVRRSNLSELDIKEIEFAENYYRVDLSWQEKNDALLEIHDLKVAHNPDQTPHQTAQELSVATPKAQPARTISRHLDQALLLREHADDPSVQRAQNQGQAIKHITRKLEGKLYSAQAKLKKDKEKIKNELIMGDAQEELKGLESQKYDLIISDPPYGNDAQEFERPTPHLYDDSYEYARKLWLSIFREGFRVTKPQANLFMHCALEHFNEIQKIAAQMGWTPWPRPVVWIKSSEGIMPWKSRGFKYCWEPIFWATKGKKGLIEPLPDWIEIYKVHPQKRLHAAEKPVALYEFFIKISTAPGSYVLDPTCGCGPIFPAANRLSCVATGIESKEVNYGLAHKRLKEDLEEAETEDEG